MNPTAQYSNGKTSQIGDVVLKRRQNDFGPEKFLVVSVKPSQLFVGVLIIANNRLLSHYAEDVPASDLFPIGVAEILIADD